MTSSASLRPIVLAPQNSNCFLHYVLDHSLKPTSLVVCSTREAFLNSLEEPDFSMNQSDEIAPVDQSVEEQTDALLIPSLRLISLSRSVNVVFVSTLSQLRAYLSVHQAHSKEAPAESSAEDSTPRTSLLAIWGLLRLHRGTFEYSAQGLCRTLGSAVDAAYSSGQKLILGEWQNAQVSPNIESLEIQNENPWKGLIPLLSSSAMNGDVSMLSQPNIKIITVVRRWCQYQEYDYGQNPD